MELAILMHSLGFEVASQSKLNDLLPRINCLGSTAFRDAVFKGNQLMLDLYVLCSQFHVQDQFKFVHVILTDGEDNSSQISQQQFLAYQLILQEKLPKNTLSTFYIGLNVENNQTVKEQMKAILQCSGDSSQYYSINSNGINDIFQKIQMQMGIRVQERHLVIGNDQANITFKQQQVSPILQFQINNYIVLFTLDISSSMQPHWNKVCQAVKGFLGNLGEGDLVLGITFNDKVNVLAEMQVQNITQYQNIGQTSNQESEVGFLIEEQDQDQNNDYDQEEDQEQDQKQDFEENQEQDLEENQEQDFEENQEQDFEENQEQIKFENFDFEQLSQSIHNQSINIQTNPQFNEKPTSEQQAPTQPATLQQNNQQQQIPIDKPQSFHCNCQIHCSIF